MRRSKLLLTLLFLTGCSHSPTVKATPAPFVLPVGPMVDTAKPNFPSVDEFQRIPFAYPPGPKAEIFLYDDATKDVWVFPGAGRGVENVSEHSPGWYPFDNTRTVLIYDSFRESVFSPIDTCQAVEYAFLPTYDGNHNLYFIGTNDPLEAATGVGRLFGAFTPFGSAAPATSSLGPPRTILPIAKVNEIQEGGVNSVSVTVEGSLLVFTTVCGGLYLYTPFHPALWKLPIAPLCASQVSLDPIWGRFVAWKEPRQKRIFILDRWRGCIDPIPFANLAGNPVDIDILGFQGNDPWHLFYFATFQGASSALPSSTRLLCYDLRDESVRTLSSLNLSCSWKLVRA